MNYKPIQLPNFTSIRHRVLDLIPREEMFRSSLFYLNNNMHLFLGIPELKHALKSLNILEDVVTVGVIVMRPNMSIPIHCDSGDFTYSLNIPLKNFDNTFVRFYKPNSETVAPIIRVIKAADSHEFDHVYSSYNPEDCTVTETHESNGAYFMNTRVPHDVTNFNDKIRVVLLVRLSNNANSKIM